MQNAELAKEQSRTSVFEAPRASDGMKTILFDVHADSGLDDRLQVALSMARAFGAHLHLLHVTPIEAYSVTDAFATYVNTQIVEALETEARKLEATLKQRMASEDVSWTYEEVTGSLMTQLVHRAALADLVVTGRPPHGREFEGSSIAVFGDMLHQLRTPLLISGDSRQSIDVFGPALVAWNGSFEAANAMRFAVPMLKLASRVRLLSLSEEKAVDFPSTSAVEYLSRHGIRAELTESLRFVETVAEDLIEQAEKDKASYIVMGGYSHSRAGEFLFGGVTRSLLKKSAFPLLMAR